MSKINYMKYRRLYEVIHGDIPDDWEVHHIDWNRKNNNIENLIAVPKAVHVAIHQSGFLDRDQIQKMVNFYVGAEWVKKMKSYK